MHHSSSIQHYLLYSTLSPPFSTTTTMLPTTTTIKKTGTSANNRLPALSMLEFATMLHQFTGDMIKVYSGQCPCHHSTNTDDVIIDPLTTAEPPIVEHTLDTEYDIEDIDTNCVLALTQMLNVTRTLQQASSISSVSSVAAPVTRALSEALAPTPPLARSPSPPPPPQRFSLRARPTKKPKRLNIKPKKIAKKRTTKTKNTSAKLSLPRAEVDKDSHVQSYITSIRNVTPEPFEILSESSSKSNNSEVYGTPDSEGHMSILEDESLIGLWLPN